ncbi:AbiTii domain-containing protein [Nodularia sp. NIES-3585]|uniref:AbiTii domain-containing protein n=1 Tax=Nodularia sp. NIES-3585 TaxID=1973477 RepID=UPI000B5C2EE1|nr:hypothetical protein [Nodularia sp. NIES-3585]GAX37674.1 leucine-rich-repeat protein [Nodularia sp. NIES-3585]
MGSLVLELQQDALDTTVTLLNLLRKALVVAKKLNIQELEYWIKNELDGYSCPLSELPEYRFMYGELKALNPYYHRWIPIQLDPETHAMISKQPVHQPISQLESLLNQGNPKLLTMPPVLDDWLRSYDHIPYEMAIHIDPSQGYKVLEAVRDVVLNWALKLEEDGILGKGMTFSQKEKEIASNHNYNNIIYLKVEQSQMQTSSSESQSNSDTYNNDFGKANIANFANKVQDNARQVASNFSQTNINQNIDEITKLISSLREIAIAKDFPQAQREETMVCLDDLEEDINNSEKQKQERIKFRLNKLWLIAGVVITVVANGADFANNVLELSEKLRIPIDVNVPHLIEYLPVSKPNQL